jgi:uncharacterized protein YciI
MRTLAVVFHRPGPKWNNDLGFREQDGIAEHVAYYRALHEAGKLELGGPYLDDSGGMMVVREGVNAAQLAEIAEADPAVVCGLLTIEVKEWFVAMDRR